MTGHPTTDRSATNLTTDPRDAKLPTRIVLSGLWVSALFACSFTVLFGFYRRDVVSGALAGNVTGTALEIDQTFLALCAAHVMLPIVMIVVSLMAPARVSRVANELVSLVHLAPMVATAGTEPWVYFNLLNALEAVLLITIVWVAWRWRARPSRQPIRPARPTTLARQGAL